MSALQKSALERMRCASCDGEGPLYFGGRCHPSSPTWSFYENGIVRVICATCRRTIADIAVAEDAEAIPASPAAPTSPVQVLITVRLGEPNVARAGRGKTAKIASTTSDLVGRPRGELAARNAAAKYFACDTEALALTLLGEGDPYTRRPAQFVAVPKEDAR